MAAETGAAAGCDSAPISPGLVLTGPGSCEFTCLDCQVHVFYYGPIPPAALKCALCSHIEAIADPSERASLRAFIRLQQGEANAANAPSK